MKFYSIANIGTKGIVEFEGERTQMGTIFYAEQSRESAEREGRSWYCRRVERLGDKCFDSLKVAKAVGITALEKQIASKRQQITKMEKRVKELQS